MSWQMVDPFNPPASIWAPWAEAQKIIGLRRGILKTHEEIRESLNIAQMGLCVVVMKEKKYA